MIIYRQKEFGVKEDLVHSGVKRTYKKWMGRIGSTISEKLDKKALEATSDHREAMKNLAKVTKGLDLTPVYEEAKKYGVRINKIDPGAQYGHAAQIKGSDKLYKQLNNTLLYDEDKAARKLKRKLANGKIADQIFVGSKVRKTEMLAHEMGHAARSHSKNPVDRVVSNIAHRPEAMNAIRGYTKPGILGSLKTLVGGKIVVAEEKGANRKAIEILKRSKKNTPEQIESVRKNLEGYTKTYEDMSRIKTLNTMSRTVGNSGLEKTGGSIRKYHGLDGKVRDTRQFLSKKDRDAYTEMFELKPYKEIKGRV